MDQQAITLSGTPDGASAGERFHYLCAGADDAPLALCLHGFPDHPHSFTPLMKHLAQAGFRAVAPWMRGYRPSVHAGPYHVERLAQDAIELCAALSPGRPAFLVGHDWGALATHVACMRAPERIAGAVTLAVPHPGAFLRNLRREPAQLLRSWYMLFFQLPRVPERVVARDDLAFIDRLWRSWSPGFALPEAARRELHACLAASMPAPLEYYRALTRPLDDAMARARAYASAAISVPTLHLHGADDGCVAPSLAAGQESLFRGPFASAVVKGAGHFLQLEAPDEVASRVVDWLLRHHVAGAAS